MGLATGRTGHAAHGTASGNWSVHRRAGRATITPHCLPVVDRSAGVCLVYAHRPVACRTYGFYVQRDQGLYCKDIESRVTGGAWAEVVWGNQDAIDRRLCSLSGTRDLTEWFVNWKEKRNVGSNSS